MALGSLPAAPWRLDDDTRVNGTVADEDEITAVVVALVRGAGIDVTADADCSASLIDALRRVATVEWTDAAPPAPLDDIDVRILALLASGESVTDVATALRFSRRTLHRRLTAIRSALGVATNREAAVGAAAGRADR
jgi:DNA-binding NarL/FixJ family response regulator